MLFDLQSGKRRRVVQVVFGGLAVLFAVSFVGFGIGGDVSGGIFDAIGLGDGSSSSSPQYDDEIDDAEQTLETDPKNERALLDLVQYHYLTATSMEEGVQRDEQTGAVVISSDAESELDQSADAWERYLATKPDKVSIEGATNAFQTESLLFEAALTTGDASAALSTAEAAAEAQQFVVDRRGTASDYGTLATYLYYTGKAKQGDAAAEQAVKKSEPASRKQIQQAMKSTAKQGALLFKEIQKRIKQGTSGEGDSSIEDPFGGIGGSSSTTP